MVNNPNLLVCPDYTHPAYAPARQPFISDTCNEAQAAEFLARAWVANNEVDKILWQQRVEAEAVRAAEELNERAAEEQANRAAAEQDKLDAKKEDQKKYRSKYIEIPDRPPPSRASFVPVTYAKQKTKQGLYVELCYFTNRGHALAKAAAITEDDHSLIPSTDPSTGDMKWIPANTKRDSSVVVLDQDLTTEDLSIAIPRFVEAMIANNWPLQRINMLKNFW
jgi:hypothetical protein